MKKFNIITVLLLLVSVMFFVGCPDVDVIGTEVKKEVEADASTGNTLAADTGSVVTLSVANSSAATVDGTAVNFKITGANDVIKWTLAESVPLKDFQKVVFTINEKGNTGCDVNLSLYMEETYTDSTGESQQYKIGKYVGNLYLSSTQTINISSLEDWGEKINAVLTSPIGATGQTSAYHLKTIEIYLGPKTSPDNIAISALTVEEYTEETAAEPGEKEVLNIATEETALVSAEQTIELGAWGTSVMDLSSYDVANIYSIEVECYMPTSTDPAAVNQGGSIFLTKDNANPYGTSDGNVMSSRKEYSKDSYSTKTILYSDLLAGFSSGEITGLVFGNNTANAEWSAGYPISVKVRKVTIKYFEEKTIELGAWGTSVIDLSTYDVENLYSIAVECYMVSLTDPDAVNQGGAIFFTKDNANPYGTSDANVMSSRINYSKDVYETKTILYSDLLAGVTLGDITGLVFGNNTANAEWSAGYPISVKVGKIILTYKAL